jgi:Cu+-exporting ATPase
MADVLVGSSLDASGTAPAPVRVPGGDVRERVVSGVRIAMEGDAHLGESSDFTFRFTDASSGRPVAGLKPYLGAAGHVVMMRADGTAFGHRHAETEDDEGRPVLALPGTTFGPELGLHARFDQPGAYRLWAQFRLADDSVLTVPFVVHAGPGGAGH